MARGSRKLKAALLSALVCPGAGQLYNKQYVKGGLLVAATLGSAIVLCWALVGAILSGLPEDVTTLDPLQVPALATQIAAGVSSRLELLSFGLMALWIYATVDAWLVAKEIAPPPPRRAPEDTGFNPS